MIGFDSRLLHSKILILCVFQNVKIERYSKRYSNKNYTGKEIPVQVLLKINRPRIGLFFCEKFQMKEFESPAYHFQFNFSKIFFLWILFRFDSDFKFSSEKFWTPPTPHKIHSKNCQSIISKICIRFYSNSYEILIIKLYHTKVKYVLPNSIAM